MSEGDAATAHLDPAHADVDSLLAALTLDEKAALTAGASLWYLPPVERLGIPALKVSDGPCGVRGESMIGRRSLSTPCGTAVGATWNPALARELGVALAGEARAKGVHVLLGPTVCIIRTPLAGRTFESFSEDPVLTTRLAVSYIQGVQSSGVGCCIKHFACNDQEHERHTISAEVDARTLRELHLPAFAAAVAEAGVWAVMTAYNKLNGTYCSEQPDLLTGILRDEWGFEGIIMSDWFGTHSALDAARAGLDLEMPGPPTWFGPPLADTVRSGVLEESVIDAKVARLLRLMARAGLLAAPGRAALPEREEDDAARRVVARRVATEGTVLLHNDGLLPLDPSAVRRVALIGPNAAVLQIGGGSSEVTPYRRRRLIDAVAERFAHAEVTYTPGCSIAREVPTLDLTLVDGPGVDGGLTVEYYDNPERTGSPAATETAYLGRLAWVGEVASGLPAGASGIRVRATFVPDVGGAWRWGLENAGRAELRIDGLLVVDNSQPERGSTFYGAGSPLVEATHDLEAGRRYDVCVDLWPRSARSPVLGVRIAARPPERADDMARAVEAARNADVAVVVVGTDRTWESEGFDRTDLELPGEQRALVEAVLAVNRRTVVAVNAGAPVALPWAQQTGALLVVWFPGEEGADALADVLAGVAEPTGRLPVSIPHRLADTAADGHYPGVDGRVSYAEGIRVGYRHHGVTGPAAHFPFGYGLTYTEFAYEPPTVVIGNGEIVVSVSLRNVGPRAGTEVVQLYVQRPGPDALAADRALVAFAKVRLEPGARTGVDFTLRSSDLARWDVGQGCWRSPAGSYTAWVGSSAAHGHGEVSFDWPGDATR
jgi:beta-glucosidase